MSTTNDHPDLPGQVHAEQTHVIVPSRPHWIEPTAEFLRKKAVLAGTCQESRSNKLVVALHEALANAIIHGNLELESHLKERDDDSFAEALAHRAADPNLAERLVDILVDYDGDRCRWIITDQGKGFDVQRALARLDNYDPEEMLASGRGILMMRSFMDEVQYEEGGRRLILTMGRASGAEKRTRPRVPFQQRLRVAPIRSDGSVDWDAAYEAISQNLSANGIALLQDKLAASARVLLGIAASRQMLYIPAEVRHCRILDDGLVELGCQFQASRDVPGGGGEEEYSSTAREEVAASIEALVASRQPVAIDHERRQHQRVVFNERLEVRASTAPQPMVGYSRDLSKGGIAFITTMVLSGLVTISIPPSAGGKPLHIRSRIVRCTEIQAGFFDVAAQFLGMTDIKA